MIERNILHVTSTAARLQAWVLCVFSHPGHKNVLNKPSSLEAGVICTPKFSRRICPGFGRAVGWSKAPSMSAPPVGLITNQSCQSLTRRMSNPSWKHQRIFQTSLFCSWRIRVVGIVYSWLLGLSFLEAIKRCVSSYQLKVVSDFFP